MKKKNEIKVWLLVVGQTQFHFILFSMTECDIFGYKQLSTFIEFQIDYYVRFVAID